MSSRSTVFVVDDDPGILNSLTWLLESVRLQVETYDSAQRFLDAYDPEQPGCLLLDLRMPGMGGFELQQLLAARGIPLPVIFVTGHGDVPGAVRALKLGAFDFFEKPFNDHELLGRVHEALAFDADSRAERTRKALVQDRVASLTPRQRGILDLVVSGATSKDIAQRLGLSLSTVEGHRIKILQRMHAKGVADLVRMITSAGIEPKAPAGSSHTRSELANRPKLGHS
jgi:FixJ family two-component response regulator